MANLFKKAAVCTDIHFGLNGSLLPPKNKVAKLVSLLVTGTTIVLLLILSP